MAQQSETKYLDFEATLMWAKVFESNRDMGPDDDSDVAENFREHEGYYKVDLVIDEATKNYLVSNGVPEAPLGNPQFRENPDGTWVWKGAKRPHVNPKFKDDDGSPVTMGPPEIVDINQPIFDEETGKRGYAPWDDRELGNGTRARVKVSRWKRGRSVKITLIKIGVIDHVPYGDYDGF